LKLDDVYKEISDVKQLLRSKLSSPSDEPVEETLFRHLIRQGLDEEQVRSLFAITPIQQSDVDDSSASVKSEKKPECGFREALGQKILELLHELSHAEPIASTSRIVALVGPTGVGKTTTIAKLAALHVLGGQRKVGLITTDTFRIAAVEQLRTYANILNVPLQVVYQPSELQHALNALADCDLILMDTAGRNFRIDRNVIEMKHILSAVPVDETYLVLAMTSKPDDLDRVAAVFQELPVDKFLFTKMDETSTYGAILNLMMTYRKPISYVTTGQNVPDDIEVANVEKVLRLIFGGAA
jgi:flagellar biosynthesis protein FlhF